MSNLSIQEILDKAESILPSEIMQRCNIPIRNQKLISSGHFKCLCPFPGHDDKTVGSFDVNDNIGCAKCFSCGCGGRSVRFYRDLMGMDSDYEAAVCLAELFGIITETDKDNLLKRNSAQFRSICFSSVPKRFSEDRERNFGDPSGDQNAPVLASLPRRTQFYSELIRHMPLSESDIAYLKNERHLSEDVIRKNFFGYSSYLVKKAFIKTQTILDWPDSYYLGIPGVFMAYPSKDDMKNNQNGRLKINTLQMDSFGLVIRDQNGDIPALQFRRYTKKESESRYLWFSSSFANTKERCKYGIKGSADAGFELADIPMKAKAIGVTEGKFKALKMAEYGIHTFSIQGVGNWKQLMKGLLEFRTAHPDYKKVWLAFDSDAQTNPAVAKSLRNFVRALEDKGFKVFIIYWDEKYGKGIDDVLNAGFNKEIKKVLASRFDDMFISPLLDQNVS